MFAEGKVLGSRPVLTMGFWSRVEMARHRQCSVLTMQTHKLQWRSPFSPDSLMGPWRSWLAPAIELTEAVDPRRERDQPPELGRRAASGMGKGNWFGRGLEKGDAGLSIEVRGRGEAILGAGQAQRPEAATRCPMG